ncbi:MAG: exopolyphosphatase [Chitinophagia bacterium]|nr:exopolyphosphatase [Chitinophagia bacterium]
MRLAAIDIGTNACRLLISEVITPEKGNPQFNKLNLIRVPLRLGFDVFETGEISKPKRGMILQTMKAYSHLMNAYRVDKHIAVATSAMRDAKNRNEVVRKIFLETGINIQIISGDFEASLIYESHIAENLNSNSNYLYIDVGGGSTEVTFFSNNQLVYKRSFNIGTIRILKEMVTEADWDFMKDEIRENIKGIKNTMAIGTGGNINKVFSLSKKKDGKALDINLLKDYYKEFSSCTVQERVRNYNLREDRADVIVPALLIYMQVMKWANIDEILVPKIGLADGLIQHLYAEFTT